MVELLIHTTMMLIVAAIAIYLILMALDIALFLKLRSSIPQEPFSDPEYGTRHALTRDGG
jgi:hypothetical protein